jgi:hypothetical protein
VAENEKAVPNALRLEPLELGLKPLWVAFNEVGDMLAADLARVITEELFGGAVREDVIAISVFDEYRD